jgi:large subunit ribosomal protein L1
VHVPIGKASFGEDALLANLRALMGELERVKPASAKGRYVKKIVVSTTMGPGVRVDLGGVAE